ncbi:MAG: type I secretion system permease/ATPase [Rhizobiaceae bacterium]|jgi:ATP-binding cassette subfamily C protein LapB
MDAVLVTDNRTDKPVGFPFKTSFQIVAATLGRPSSETVLFSGVPFDPADVAFEDVERLASRLGLDASLRTPVQFAAGDIEFPAIAFFHDGSSMPLLAQAPDGTFETSLAADLGQRPSVGTLLSWRITQLVTFTVFYANASENLATGEPETIERRHWLIAAIAPFWRSYVRVALAAFFINLIALASPLFVRNVYDRVLPNKATSTLWVLAIGLATAILFDLLLKTARAAIIDYAGRRADMKLSYVLFEKVLNASLWSRPALTGDYANRISQYEFVREFFTSNTLSVLIDTLFVFIFLAAIYAIAGWIVIIPAIAFIAAFIIGLVAQWQIGRRVVAAANESAQRHSLLVETISTIETIKSLRAEATLLRKWQQLTHYSTRTSEEIKQLSAAAANSTGFVQQLVSVSIIVAGAYEFADGNMTTGAIIAATMLASRTIAPMGQIALTLARLRQAMFSLKILNMIMAQPEDNPRSVGFVNRQISAGNVEFRNVEFNYPMSEQQALRGISFTIRAGERVGIIGRIGSGKTTLGRLIGGLYPPAAGNLLIDGIDIRQYHPAEIRAAVGIAGQSSDLFSGSVKENLLLGRPDATDKELLAVASATGVSEIVARHPRGFDMPVGERGNNLSGGQKQAVIMARLLLTRPKLVFLDEPSGAMDLASERALISKLAEAFDKTTTLIVATHRFSMLELVDRLIVIDQGLVVADGPKAKVIEDLQQRAAKPPIRRA